MEIITGTSAQALDTEVALSKEVYTVEEHARNIIIQNEAQFKAAAEFGRSIKAKQAQVMALKIPKYIYEWMALTAHYSYKAAELNRKVAEWLERHGVDVDALSCGCGYGFEELMYGNDVTDKLCERIEREAANADISQK